MWSQTYDQRPYDKAETQSTQSIYLLFLRRPSDPPPPTRTYMHQDRTLDLKLVLKTAELQSSALTFGKFIPKWGKLRHFGETMGN